MTLELTPANDTAAVASGGPPVTTTFTDSPVQPANSETNPYIAGFILSMSQEGDQKQPSVSATGATATKKRQPLIADNSSGSRERGDETAAKKPRVNATSGARAAGDSAKTRSHRRAVRSGAAAMEGVCKELEKMRVAPPRNRYVERFVREVEKERCGCVKEGKSTSGCPKVREGYRNPYVSKYHQRLGKRERVCQQQTCMPNCYVAQLHRR